MHTGSIKSTYSSESIVVVYVLFLNADSDFSAFSCTLKWFIILDFNPLDPILTFRFLFFSSS